MLLKGFKRFYSRSTKQVDAVVIGGGHNGLVAAAYLQKNGYQVCVLERRHIIGGAAVTEEIIPDFKFSRASYVLSLLRPQIYRELKLSEFGLRVLPRDPSSYTPVRSDLWINNAKSLTLGTDAAENAREIGKFSKCDASVFSSYEEQLGRISAAIEPLLDVAPNRAMNVFCGTLTQRLFALWNEPNLRLASQRLLHLGPEVIPLFELLTAAPLKILKRWFENEVLITTLAMDAVIGTMESPYAAGTGYVLLLHSMLGECDGGKGRWGYPVGGMGAVSQAIAASAKALGVQIITNQEVKEILIDGDGNACGVRTSDGTEIPAKIVLSNATAKVTFIDLLPTQIIDSTFRSALNTIDYSSGVTKINVAVKTLPNFLADPSGSSNKSHHQATIHINSERIECLENAYNDASIGKPSQRPLIEMVIPSVLDSTIAPKGGHVVLLFTQYTPYKLRNGLWDEKNKEVYAKSVFDCIDEYAPGFSESIIGKEILTPPDLENIFGITGGNIFHGAMTPDRLFVSRPVPLINNKYVSPLTPIGRLILCGSGSHPGGGVSGSPGRIAAMEAIHVLSKQIK